MADLDILSQSRQSSLESRPESTISRLRNRTWSGLTYNGLGIRITRPRPGNILLIRFLVPQRSNISTWSTAQDLSQSSQKQEAQVALILVVTGIRLNSKKILHSPALTSSCNWYLAFLEFKILQAWTSLLAPILKDVDSKAAVPCDHDIAIAFRFLAAVAARLQRNEVALANIVDEVYNDCLVYHTDNHRSKAHQLAFAALGWISMSKNVKFNYIIVLKRANRCAIYPIFEP